MNKSLVLLASWGVSSLGLCALAPAQDQLVHTVSFPMGDVAWAVTFQVEPIPGQPSPPKPRDRQVAKIDIVRKGGLRHDLVTWSNDSTTEYWWSGNPAFVLHQDGPDAPILIMKTGNMNDSRYDETFFTWIGADTFKDLRDFQHKSCHYYEKKIVLLNGDKALLRGWIENKTGLPVGWSQTGILSLFNFDVPLSPAPLVMPQKFQDAMAHMQTFFVFPKRNPAQ